MAIVKLIDAVTAWVQEEICNKVKLKMPPGGDEKSVAANYDYTLVTPACFPLFIPTKEKRPPAVLSSNPSICVKFAEGEEDITRASGSMAVDLCFSVWDPGTHGKDLFNFDKTAGKYKQFNGPEADKHFEMSVNGWRDAWNWVDVGLRAIESVSSIGGYSLDRSTAVTFGQIEEQEDAPDFYPMWYAWISFKLKYPVIRNESFKELL